MASITTIRSTDFHVVNCVGRLLFTSSDRRIALTRAKQLAPEFGDVSVQRVTVMEDRETVRRVRAPRVEGVAA